MQGPAVHTTPLPMIHIEIPLRRTRLFQLATDCFSGLQRRSLPQIVAGEQRHEQRSTGIQTSLDGRHVLRPVGSYFVDEAQECIVKKSVVCNRVAVRIQIVDGPVGPVPHPPLEILAVLLAVILVLVKYRAFLQDRNVLRTSTTVRGSEEACQMGVRS